jgi:uncharacterized protein (TIRG00374 family)
MRLARYLLVVAGLASVVYLATTTGIDVLLASVRTLSWRLAVFIVIPYTVVALLHTIAWRLVLVPAPLSLRRLFSIRLVGEALNLGAASVGGEPVKVYLLKGRVPLAEASAAQIVDKTGITVGQVLFLVVGIVIAILRFDLSADVVWAVLALLAVQIIVVSAFVAAQCVGLGDRTLRLLDRLGMAADRVRASGYARFERMLAAAYRERRGAVLACVLVHLLAWLVGSLEVYLVLRWLDVRASFAAALAIDAFGAGIKFMAFAIPGALGVLEGGYMVLFSAFGFDGGLGLSFTLVRRLRMVAWSVAGLVALALLRDSATPAPVSAAVPEG